MRERLMPDTFVDVQAVTSPVRFIRIRDSTYDAVSYYI
jgi:hypothetical protein